MSIAPRGAKIDAAMLAQRRLDLAGFTGEAVMGTILKDVASVLSEKERIKVWGITPSQEVYVLGNVSKRGDELVVGEGDGDFFVSTRSEEQSTKRLRWQAVLLKVGGVALVIGGTVCVMNSFI